MLGLSLPNLLRPLSRDPLVVDVTVWIPGTITDSEGNKIVDPRATSLILKGWDIQPLPSTMPPSFSPAGSVEVPDLHKAFAPREHLEFIGRGRPVKNNSNNKEYRIGGIQDWGSHLEILLEVSN
jgi:hypothetical protein